MRFIKVIFLGIFSLCVFLSMAQAAPSRVSYWLVPQASFSSEVRKEGSVSDIPVEQLNKIAVGHGSFEGKCSVWFQSGAMQIIFRAADDGQVMDYDINVSWSSGQGIHLIGQVEPGKYPVARSGWQEDPFVLVFKRL